MKKITLISIFIISSYTSVYAPNLGDHEKKKQQEEIKSIVHLQSLMEGDLKEYSKYFRQYYTNYKKKGLEEVIHKILTIKSVSIRETGNIAETYNNLTKKQRWLVAYNEPEEAVGLLQIRPVMHEHLTKELRLCSYELKERWNTDASIMMFIHFQNHYNKEWNLEKAARDWNGGGDLGMEKTATIKYYKAVYTNYKKLIKKYELVGFMDV